MSDVPISSGPEKGNPEMGGAVDSSYELAPQEAPGKTEQGEREFVMPGKERICPYCGFTVRGRTRGNRCPECSAALDESTAELLQFSDTAWVREISWGAVALGLAAMVHLAGLVSWPWWAGIRMGMDGTLPKRPEGLIAGTGLHVLGALLGLIGVWIVTAREPAGGGRRGEGAAVAQVCRWGSVMVFLLWAGAWALGVKKWGAEFAVLNFCLLAMAGEVVAVGYFASGIAHRVPHDGLANQFRNMMVMLPPFFGFLLLCRFVDVTEYYKMFFLSLPLIFALMGLVVWVAVSFWRLTWELWAAARVGEQVVEKRATRAQTRDETRRHEATK